MKPAPLFGLLGASVLLVAVLLLNQKSASSKVVVPETAKTPPVAPSSVPKTSSSAVVDTTPALGKEETVPGGAAPATAGVAGSDPPAARPLAAKELTTESGRVFLDGEFGVGGEIPEGWRMSSSARWGVRQNTIWFQDPLVPAAMPALYYKINPELMHKNPEEVRQWMLNAAAEKERQRVAEGRADYKNHEEMRFHQIGDRPALTWSATYTRNGEPWVENMTRLYSPAGTVLFFLHAPATDIDAAQASFNTVIESTVMPP